MGQGKREERKQRSEEHKAEQERLARKKRFQSRAAFVVVVVLGLVVAGYFATSRPKDGEERNGRVWSAAHGHWHDKYGGH